MTDTIALYDKMAQDYAKIANDLPNTLTSFLAELPTNARVLDLACGPGHHARILAAAGHDVLAVDGSSEMVALAAAQPGVRAQQSTFDEIGELGRFDAVWASFALLHAPRKKFPVHILAVKSILELGGLFSITLKLGTGEDTDKLGRFYSYFSEIELLEILTNAGFTIGRLETGEVKGMAGHLEPWIGIEAHA